MARNRREVWMQTGTTAQTWLVSFTDIIALMLAFFVLIFSLINPEREILSNITFSLQDNPGRSDVRIAGGFDADAGQRLSQHDGEDLNYLAASLKAYIRQSDPLSGVYITQQPERLIVSIPGGLLFESGAVAMTDQGRQAIEQMAGVLKNIRNAVYLRGSSDPAPISEVEKTRVYQTNWGLGLLRAQNVADALNTGGLDRIFNIMAITAPSDLPKSQWAGARRVDIIIHRKRPL